MTASFYSQASANRRNSFLLVLVIVALLALLGFTIGYGTTRYSNGAAVKMGDVITKAEADMLLRKEIDGIVSLCVKVAEETVFPAGEREIRHRGSYAKVNADIAHAGFIAEFSRCAAAACGWQRPHSIPVLSACPVYCSVR